MDEVNITSAQWIADPISGQTQAAIRVTINNVQWDVPLDPANRHYAEILRQVEANTLTIADAE